MVAVVANSSSDVALLKFGYDFHGTPLVGAFSSSGQMISRQAVTPTVVLMFAAAVKFWRVFTPTCSKKKRPKFVEFVCKMCLKAYNQCEVFHIGSNKCRVVVTSKKGKSGQAVVWARAGEKLLDTRAKVMTFTHRSTKLRDFFFIRSRSGAMKRNDSPSAMICFASHRHAGRETLQMVGVLAVPAGGQKTKTREFCVVHGSQGKRGAPCYFTPDRSQHAACTGDIAMTDWCMGKVTSRPGFISLVIDHK